MSVIDLRTTKDIPKQTVYELLKHFELYDGIKDTIYHLNIKYLPYHAVLDVIAPNLKLNSRQSATFIYNTVKFCDETSPNYNRNLDEKLTAFGANYKVDDSGFTPENFNDNYNDFINESNGIRRK